jgi:hypothetical protein
MEEDLKYPIGEFQRNLDISPQVRQIFIKEISELPQKIENAVKDLSDVQLDTPYRPGAGQCARLFIMLPTAILIRLYDSNSP